MSFKNLQYTLKLDNSELWWYNRQCIDSVHVYVHVEGAIGEGSAIARAQLRELIGALPRVDVAHTPTPLEECPRLSDALGGPRILIKRGDAD